jgi:hypothetical protein
MRAALVEAAARCRMSQGFFCLLIILNLLMYLGVGCACVFVYFEFLFFFSPGRRC